MIITNLGADATPAATTQAVQTPAPVTYAEPYSALTDSACALIPACTVYRLATGKGSPGSGTTPAGIIDQAKADAQNLIAAGLKTGTADALAKVQALQTTIAWAATGIAVALLAVGGAVVYSSMRKR